MTKKIKFITRLLVLTLFSIFISCNDELYDIKDQHNGIDKNKISLTQFKNETSLVGIEPLLSVYNKTSISSKSKAQLSDFVIDTIAIKKHISLSNKTTYTFRIYPLSSVAQPNEIYNLVYRKVNNTWETSIFYLKKFPKENSEHKLFEKIERIYGGKVTNGVTSKTSSLEMCSFTTTSYHCTDPGICDGTGKCDLCHLCVSTSITYMSCDSGGSSSGGGSFDPGGTYSSGGGSSDPYSYSPNTYDNPVYDDPEYINRINTFTVRSNLGDVVRGFFAEIVNISFFDQTIQYQIANNWSPESKEIADQAREYKYENPDVTWAQFQNWFMGSSAGIDGDYDASIWENPNLIFPAQSLPSFNDFKNACPSKNIDAGSLCNDMGGEILEMYNAVIAKGKKLNTCAIRISKAFQGSGIVIPALPDNPNGTKNTVKDKNGNNIIINAKVLNQWMRKTFGTNPSNYLHIKASQGGYNGKEFPKLLENKQGIYSMIARPEIQKDWGTGHADLLENGECRQNCHFYDENNLFVPVDYIDIWILN